MAILASLQRSTCQVVISFLWRLFQVFIINWSKNIRINGYNNIRAVNCAAVENASPVEMYHWNEFNEGATTLRKGLFETEPIIVEGIPLSDILSETEIKTTRLVKIDVEGVECSTLKGMSSVLHQFPKDVEIIVEIAAPLLKEEDLLEIYSIFKKEGFYPYVIENLYDEKYYMNFKEAERPAKMKTIPLKTKDVIFSRIDNEYLEF